jgi:hypothetical protein
LLHASFRPRLATTPLRFAITSPPSGCEEDLHLQAIEHARHTTKPLARRTLRVRYFRNHGLQPRPESPFASCSYLFIILSIAGESRFNSHSLTASAANASGFLQVAVSEAPSQSAFELELSRAGSPDTAIGLMGTNPSVGECVDYALA